MARIGFLGLGTMGQAIAGRLVDAGLDVTVWNRTPGKSYDLISRGAVTADSPAEVFGQCNIVFSILANDSAVDATCSPKNLSAANGVLHVNMATISLEKTRELADRHRAAGVRYVAAPVLGRPEVAAVGQLNVVAAGAATDIDEAEPFISHFSKQVWRVGEQPEQANLVKIGVNFNLIHALQALGESVSLLEKGGIDGQLFVDILTDAAFSGSAYTGYGALIAAQRYRPASFSVELGLKDLSLAEQAASELDAALPTVPTIKAMFEEALRDDSLSDGDWSIIAEVIRRGPKLDGDSHE